LCFFYCVKLHTNTRLHWLWAHNILILIIDLLFSNHYLHIQITHLQKLMLQ
jgi:hypothetical protein